MKTSYLIIVVACIMSWIAPATAQRTIRASAIYVQLPINYRNADIIISNYQIKVIHRGTELYLANLYPDDYEVNIRNGHKITKIAVKLNIGTQTNIQIAPDGKPIQTAQVNPNNNLLPYIIKKHYNPREDIEDGQVYPIDNPDLTDYIIRRNNHVLNEPNENSYQSWFKGFKNCDFDATKVDYIKKTLKFDLNLKRATEIMEAFSSDTYRMKAAKVIKNRINDPAGIAGLTETFTFEAYKKEFLDELNK